jgi:hypothetical protein
MNKPDPQAVGEWLLKARLHPYFKDHYLSEVADTIPWDKMPNVESSSLVDTTVSQYREELTREADNGIRSAVIALERLDYPASLLADDEAI